MRTYAPVLLCLLFATLVTAACNGSDVPGETGDGPPADDTEEAAEPGPLDARLQQFAAELVLPSEGLECERDGFPCSWAAASDEVFRASVSLGEATMARLDEASIADAEAALREDPRVVEVTATDRALAFRLDGGRRIWVLPSDDLDLRGAGVRPETPRPGIARPKPGLGSSISLPEVLGKDTDGNDRLNQRDRRRALVLDPFFWEFTINDPDYAEGADVAAILEGSGLYDVDLRVDGEADVAAFRGWDEYDAVHIGTHGTWGLTITGEVFDASNLDTAARARAQTELASIGVDLVLISKKDKKNDLDRKGLDAEVDPKLEGAVGSTADAKPRVGSDEWIAQNTDFWSLGVTGDFFRDQYSGGLGRSIVLFNSCRSYSTDVAGALLSEGRAPEDRAAIFAWDETVATPDAVRAGLALWTHLVEDKIDAYEAWRRLARAEMITSYGSRAGYADGTLALYPSRAHRAVEIVSLFDSSGTRLRDGSDLNALLAGEAGDGEEDELSVRMRIEGITGSQLIDDMSSEDERPFMEAWLELDGRRIGESDGLVDEPLDNGTITLEFEDVPLGFDVELDEEYELEAVVRLPPEEDEGGYSRYSARLTARSSECYWNASVSGLPQGPGAISASWGRILMSQERSSPLSIDAWVREEETQPGPPWLRVLLRNRATFPRSLQDAKSFVELQMAIPGMEPGRTGTFTRVWGTLDVGTEGYAGNAAYWRTEGVPGGQGVGNLLTTDVTITENTDERVSGVFDARFLDLSRLPSTERTPAGVGVHGFPDAEIRVTGDFSILRDGSCSTGVEGFRR